MLKKYIISIFVLAVLGASFLFWSSQRPESNAHGDLKPNPIEKEEKRIDILILGTRGEDDPDAETGGALLTDTIQILSYNTETASASMISLPRDLYVSMTPNHKDRINSAYVYSLNKGYNDIDFMKVFYSELTGVHIDHVVIFNFSSFKKIIDTIGGVDIILAQPFEEKTQWGYEFYLPAGKNHLDGQQALYYARSRFSTNDFDRSRRQQQLILAIKSKLDSLNLLDDPLKFISLYNLIKNNIEIDITVWNINELLPLARNINTTNLRRTVLSLDNVLIDSRGPNGEYILLPKDNDWGTIRRIFKESL